MKFFVLPHRLQDAMPDTSTGRLRRVLVAVTALATCVPAVATATTSSAGSGASFAGVSTVTLVGERSSGSVRLPKPVTLNGDCFPDRTVEVRGSADAVMLILVPAAGGRSIAFGRFPKREGGSTFSNVCGPDRTLDAGTYNVTALRSRGSATVTLRFPGLNGRVGLKLSKSSSAHLVDLPRVPAYEGTSGNVTSFGATRELSSQGLIAVIGWVTRDEASALVTVGDCEMRRAPTSDARQDTIDFAPGCPTGSSSSSLPGPSGKGTNFFAGGYTNIGADNWGVGFYYVSSSKAVTAGAIAAWIPYDE